MREDPIVFEDWSIGFPDEKFIRPIIRIDGLISVFLNLIFISLGFQKKSGAAIFGFISLLIIMLVIEVLIDQHARNINNRILTIFAYFGVVYLFAANVISDASPYIIVGIATLLLVKIGFIPLVVASLLVTSEVLVPKSEYAKLKLKQHVNMLAITEYAIDANKINSERKELGKELILPYAFGTIVVTIVSLIIFQVDELIANLIILVFQLFLVASGVSIFSLLLLWKFETSSNFNIPILGRLFKSKKNAESKAK